MAPKHIEHLTTVKPAEILADADLPEGVSEADYSLIWEFSDEASTLEYGIADAVVELLPDDLLVRIQLSSDPDCIWEVEVCSAVTRSTSRVREYREEHLRAQLRPHGAVIQQLFDLKDLAKRINLDERVRKAAASANAYQYI